ncbi:ABC transporter permease subunit [Bradyrhizobium sp. Arg816]|uniref:ABC transporter permease subunit n=1 Tax=Bradyrhizobium sp. Arg816 TaxID=2998491 RepID=UPI00249DBFDE|nr:ABC transporter permease subunit [Bradyrhizobium sp. Arg816]MDI3567469.1 ABC transporter permease subunit [Bradyrhizobium sp. Arg816]
MGAELAMKPMTASRRMQIFSSSKMASLDRHGRSYADGGLRSMMRWLRRPAVRSVVWQVLLVTIVGGAVCWIAGNVITNMPRLKMELRWGFLNEVASFELGDNLFGYRAGDSYMKAFAAGLANTLQVSVIGMMLTAFVATLVALLRLSGNLLMNRMAWLYVEIARNLPLLLQLLFWQSLLIRRLPPPSAAWHPLPDIVVSNRGVTMARLEWQSSFDWALLALVVSLVLAAVVRHRRSHSRVRAAGPPLYCVASTWLVASRWFRSSLRCFSVSCSVMRALPPKAFARAFSRSIVVNGTQRAA